MANILFSPWFLAGFVLGAVAGTLATDLTREEVLRREKFGPTLRFWQWSRLQSLVFIAGMWATLLVATIILARWPGTNDWWKSLVPGDSWKDLLFGSVIGSAAAPWVWLHFVRNFGADGEREQAGKEALITARAHQIWLQQGQPTGRADEHYAAAKKEVEDNEQWVIETSAKSAEQQLARYRLVSILFGIALLFTMLLPVLQNWLGRAQQFQAFGISLTLIGTQQSNQGRGTPLVGYESSPNSDRGSDRLLRATTDAYQIAAANPEKPLSSVWQIGPALTDFGYLSVIDRDRAFISWLTYELPGNGQLQTPPNQTLISYIEQAEGRLQNSPARWADPTLDMVFAAGSTFISDCLREDAKETHDPHFFTIEVGRFLRSFVQEVYKGPLTVQLDTPVYSPDYLGNSSELPDKRAVCDFSSSRLAELDAPFQLPTNARFKISPYPTLIAANYLAAIGAVDTGVLLLEDWIDTHHTFAPEQEPQLGWYLIRAKLSAVNLPYQFGGLTIAHRQLVGWQLDESVQLGRLLRVGDSEGWKRLCSKLLTPTLHNNIGQWLAFIYATERFYLLENLWPEDFGPNNDLGLGSLQNISERRKQSATIKLVLTEYRAIPESGINLRVTSTCILHNSVSCCLRTRAIPFGARASSTLSSRS